MAETTPDQRARAVTATFRDGCEELFTAWESLTDVEPRRNQGTVTRVLYRLALVAVSSAQASFSLVDRGGSTDAFPLSRRALEFGVTSQWILHKGEQGIRAMEAKTERQAKTTLRHVGRRLGGAGGTG